MGKDSSEIVFKRISTFLSNGVAKSSPSSEKKKDMDTISPLFEMKKSDTISKKRKSDDESKKNDIVVKKKKKLSFSETSPKKSKTFL